ncbi:MAG: Ig-like domain repeat protein [Methanosphaera sp.]|nr:Ig-like domain repeat protein [Methanosphaera sp.]
MNYKIIKTFILVTLLALLVGVTCATDISTDTISTTGLDVSSDSVSTDNTLAVAIAIPTTIGTVQESVTGEQTENNEIIKEEKNMKAENTPINVGSFQDLRNTFGSSSGDVIVNITKNITLQKDVYLSDRIKLLTIEGNGFIINGNSQHQFLTINSITNVTINNITITNCYGFDGGALKNRYGGTITITNSNITHNTADMGGAIYNNDGILSITNSNITHNTATGQHGSGGAIYNMEGKLTIKNSVLNDNIAHTEMTKLDIFGGAVYNNNGTLNIIQSTLNNNKVSNKGWGGDSYGGAVYNKMGNLTINGSTLNSNTVTGDDSFGGAVYSDGKTSITDSTMNNNCASSNEGNYGLPYGGAIYNVGDLTIKNATICSNSARKDFRMSSELRGAICNKGTLNMYNTTLCNNDEAIYNYATLAMTNTILSNNTISNDDGKMRISNCSLNNNSSIYNYNGEITVNKSILTNNTRYDGGAIYNLGGIIRINNSSLNDNEAYNPVDDAAGGAIYNSEGLITISNSILTNNKVSGYDISSTFGGAIYNEGNLVITASSLTNNTAPNGSAIYNVGSASIENNTFKKNKANTTGKAIINTGIAKIKDNINDDTSVYSSTIYNAANANITKNIFDDGMINTKTTTSTVSGVIGEKLKIKATVTDTNNKKVNKGNLIFKLNGVTIKDNGKLTGSSNPLKVKVTNGVATATITPDLDMRNADKLTAHYIGTDNYNASASSAVKIQISQRNASIVVSSNVRTIKQGQVLTLIAKVYDTTGGKKSTNLTKYADEFVYFKVNGITLKDNKGQMLKVKIVNGTATTKYTIPLGLSGVTDGKSMSPKNHTILAGFYNKNYQENIRNTSTFQVERSNITITIANATVNNKTHKMSLTATIKDYLGNIVAGPNKCVIKINGVSLKNGTQPMYYYSTDGILNIKNINIPSYNKYTSIEIVTQDRLAYKSQRNTTTVIKVTN